MKFTILFFAVVLSGGLFLGQAAADVAARSCDKSVHAEAHACATRPDAPQ